MNPFFSIALTNKNYGDYLEQSISSVLSQSFSDWELIIGDDGSTDHSNEILQEFSKISDLRVSIHNFSSVGVGRLRNILFEKSHGKFLLYLDSDDYYLPDFLDRLYDAIQLYPGRHVFQYFDRRYDVSNQRFYRNQKVYREVHDISDLLNPEFQETAGGNFCLSREAFFRLKGFDTELFGLGWEDFDLWVRAVRDYGCVPTHVDSLVYRMNKPNLSRTDSVLKDESVYFTLTRNLFRKHPEMCIFGSRKGHLLVFPEESLKFSVKHYPYSRRKITRYRRIST